MLYLNLALVLALTFRSNFDSGIDDAWIHSEWKGEASAKFEHVSGEEFEGGGAMLTNTSSRFYTMTTSMNTVFSVGVKPLYVHYTVAHPQTLDCGGAYIKLYPPELKDLAAVRGGENETPYNIMFGPDVCGSNNNVHLIIAYNSSNVQNKHKVVALNDRKIHSYGFGLLPGGFYFVVVDGEVKRSGEIMEDYPFLAPLQIDDPEASKPDDWVDEAMIEDSSVTKPEGWDDVPKEIPDETAVQPEDWDEEEDGEWSAPTKPNPDYKGEWTPTRIPNPDYKGPWSPPKIDNPAYVYDDTAGNFTVGVVGFEIWQVKAGTVFDSLIITQEESEFYKAGNASKEFAAERTAKEEEERKKTEEKAEKERKAKEEEENGETSSDTDDEETEKDEL